MKSDDEWKQEFASVFFHSILTDLALIEDDLSDFEIKQLVLRALQKVPEMDVEWGEADRFGKSTLLIKKGQSLLVVESTALINTIRVLWSEYLANR